MSTSYQSIVVQVSSNQLKTLVSSPITIIPAPGLGKYVQLEFVAFDYIAGTPYVISGTEIPELVVNGNQWNAKLQTTGFLDQTVNTILMLPVFPTANFESSEVINQPVVLGNTGTNLAGGTGSVIVTATYQIVAIQ
jgi:hypothetical protein